MRKYLTMLVLLIAGTAAFAQQHSVKGTVVDSQGYPVIGMTVMEKGTQNGTTTDADGNYLLNLSSASSAVEFNALGYKAVTEQVAGRSVINIMNLWTITPRCGLMTKLTLYATPLSPFSKSLSPEAAETGCG